MKDADRTLSMSMFETTEGVGQTINVCGTITTKFANLCAEKMEAGIKAKLLELGWMPPALVSELKTIVYDMIGDSRDDVMSARWRAACEWHGSKLLRIVGEPEGLDDPAAT